MNMKFLFITVLDFLTTSGLVFLTNFGHKDKRLYNAYPNQISIYSYRNASIGLILTALRAGK